MFSLGEIRFVGWIGFGNLAQFDRIQLGRPFAAIGNRIGRDTKQPRRKWSPAPFEARQILERAMKHIGGEILA